MAALRGRAVDHAAAPAHTGAQERRRAAGAGSSTIRRGHRHPWRESVVASDGAGRAAALAHHAQDLAPLDHREVADPVVAGQAQRAPRWCAATRSATPASSPRARSCAPASVWASRSRSSSSPPGSRVRSETISSTSGGSAGSPARLLGADDDARLLEHAVDGPGIVGGGEHRLQVQQPGRLHGAQQVLAARAGLLQTRPTVVPSGSSVSRSRVAMLASARSATAGGPSSGMARLTSWMWKNVVITTR